jgi:hypothetical protein
MEQWERELDASHAIEVLECGHDGATVKATPCGWNSPAYRSCLEC